MSSAVKDLQKAILDGKQSLTQLLRQTKLIAARLNLEDVERWVDSELKGYPDNVEPPAYRQFTTNHVEIRNPVRGWVFGGHFPEEMKAYEPIAEIENLSKGQQLKMPLQKNLPVRDSSGGSFGSDWPQRIVMAGSQFQHILERVKNELLQWTIELDKRGIKGEDMDFDEKEKKSASTQVFNIQKFTGVFGNVTNSQVTLYDYGSINQLLIDRNIPTQARNWKGSGPCQCRDAQES